MAQAVPASNQRVSPNERFMIQQNSEPGYFRSRITQYIGEHAALNNTPQQIRKMLQAEYLDSLVEKAVTGYLEYDRAGFSDSEAAERGLQAVFMMVDEESKCKPEDGQIKPRIL